MSSSDNSDPEYATATTADIVPPREYHSDILIIGPTLSDKDKIAFDLLAESWKENANPFVVTATEPERTLRSRVQEFVPPGRSAADLYVIDCSESTSSESQSTCSVASPADLTGVGICLAKGYEKYGTSGKRRILIDNLSTLMIYSEIGRLYRFVSTINSRSAQVGDMTVQLLDADTIKSEDKTKLYQLFSTVIQVRMESGKMLFRVRGETNTEWYEYRSPERETR